jgi:HEAT repeat protein
MPLASASFASRLAGLTAPEQASARERLIMSGLEAPDPGSRETAIAWAARYLEPHALVLLVARADHATLRNAALAALERQGPYALAVVEAMLRGSDPDVVMFGCQVLGHIGTAGSAGDLLRLAQHSHVNIAQAAIEALGRLRVVAAVPVLVQLLERELWLQLAAIDALAAIGDARAVGPLLGLMGDEMLARHVVEALARIAAPESLLPLTERLLTSHAVGLQRALLRAIASIVEQGHATETLIPAGRVIAADRSPEGVAALLATILRGDQPELEEPLEERARDDRQRSRGGDPTVRAAATVVVAAGVRELLPLVMRWGAGQEGAAWLRPLMQRYPQVLRPSLDELLAHPDAEVRCGVLAAGRFASTDLDRLRARLADPAEPVRAAAYLVVAELGDEPSVPMLLASLVEGSESEKMAAVTALARMDPAVLEAPLAPLLAEGTAPDLRVAVLRVLEGKSSAALEDRILELARDRSSAVRQAALRVVAGLEGSKAEVLLLRALADRDEAIQVGALDLLIRRPGARVTDTLLALLHTGDSLRCHVIRALGRLGDVRAAGPLETLFPQAPLHEQLEVVTALVRLSPPVSLPFLRRCLEFPHPEIRRVAAQGVADLATRDDLDLLQRLAEDPDWAVRNQAGQGLGRLGLPAARRTLLDLARDLEPIVARTARAALELGGPAGVR